jgi:PAS domain S-box-containing protein
MRLPMYLHTNDQVKVQVCLLDHVSDAIVAIDTEQCITYWNRRTEQLFGMTADAALGRPLTQICAAVWLSSLEAQEDLAHTGWWHGEQVVRTHGGVARSVEVSARWLTESSGHLIGWVARFRETTDRRRATAEGPAHDRA